MYSGVLEGVLPLFTFYGFLLIVETVIDFSKPLGALIAVHR